MYLNKLISGGDKGITKNNNYTISSFVNFWKRICSHTVIILRPI